jgi:hypothetical protein
MDMMSIGDAERLRGEAPASASTDGADPPRALSNAERSRRFRARRRQQRQQVLQYDLNRLFVDMAGEILRAPYSVDERAALLGWAALQFMRARRGAPL